MVTSSQVRGRVIARELSVEWDYGRISRLMKKQEDRGTILSTDFSRNISEVRQYSQPVWSKIFFDSPSGVDAHSATISPAAPRRQEHSETANARSTVERRIRRFAH